MCGGHDRDDAARWLHHHIAESYLALRCFSFCSSYDAAFIVFLADPDHGRAVVAAAASGVVVLLRSRMEAIRMNEAMKPSRPAAKRKPVRVLQNNCC